MTANELKKILDGFRNEPIETEWLEFKEAKNDFDFPKLGRYFSALSNEANLKNKDSGWLIFGVEDKTKHIVGTKYKSDRASLDKLKQAIAEKTNGRITFLDIYELLLPEGRVLMFRIPPASQGIPTSWEGHYYGRDGESLTPLNIQEIEQIRAQSTKNDWSAKICETATLNDLDEEALAYARKKFKEKNKDKTFAEEIDKWDTATFLDKARVTINGKITNTAIILLGKPESSHYLSPAVAQITWKLETHEQGYEHFTPPFLLNTTNVYTRIRNTKHKFLAGNTLFPIEIDKYERWVILEALHNCIAHQDYTRQARIIVTEKEDELLFFNAGGFFTGTVDDYTLGNKTPEIYRNFFLAQAMVNIGMIESMGFGIKKMFLEQKRRFFPLPQYDLSIPDKVLLRIIGKVLDENYTSLLIQKTELSLDTVIYLDKIQKKEKLTKEAVRILKKQNLVEGRYPNLFISSGVATVTKDQSLYIKNRAFDNKHYKDMIISYLKKFENANRQDIDKLVLDKLSDVLDEMQKIKKIDNLLQEMARKDKTIKNIGSRKNPKWTLTKVN